MNTIVARTSPDSVYRRGTFVAMAIYVMSIMGVSLAVRFDAVDGALLVALALLPGLAIVGQIFVTVRYLRDADEFIRALLGKRLIAACMTTLAIFTVWGFLEQFTEIVGPPAWAAYPLMWGLFGLSCMIIKDSK